MKLTVAKCLSGYYVTDGVNNTLLTNIFGTKEEAEKWIKIHIVGNN